MNAFQHVNATLQVSADRLLWRLLHAPGAHGGGAPPAVLYVLAFRLGCDCRDSRRVPGGNGGGSGGDACWCPWYWDMGGVEARVARHYGLPVASYRDAGEEVGGRRRQRRRRGGSYYETLASYRDAVWPDMAAPPPDLASAFWHSDDGGIHPDAVAHELLADTVKYALGRLLLVGPPPPPQLGTPQEQRPLLAACAAKRLAAAVVPFTTLALAQVRETRGG